MRLELAERLRCPAAHVPTPLIVVAQHSVDRELVTAMLGCPVCRLEARIVAGDVRFGPLTDDLQTASGDADVDRGVDRGAEPAPDLGRVVALLGLSEPGGAVLLTGRYAALARPLAACSDVSVVIMHGPAPRGAAAVSGAERAERAERAEGVDQAAVATVYRSPGTVPFTDGTFRAVALDTGLPASFGADAVRTTAIAGRVLAESSVPLPIGVKELARDDTEWVAARESTGAIVELKRRV